jgi:hypothetical protein
MSELSGGRTDSLLSAAVYESFYWVSIDFHVDTEESCVFSLQQSSE